MELYNMTATALSELLKNKKISSRELTDSVFNRIEENDKKVEAYLEYDRDRALVQADAADKMIADGTASALTGIPVGIKDNICTKGVSTTCASKILENFVPPYDACVIEKLKEKGTVLTGKLNMDEFAMGSSCENSHFKKTKNPHDITKVPGGSSGGSAAAVASGECVLALGSDTGGSIRQPSSYCGVIGLKPTYGAVSRYGLVAFASSLDQIGPIGRSVGDVKMLFEAIRGRDSRDATSCAAQYFGKCGSIKGLKIGIPKEYFIDGIALEVRESVMKAAEEFKKLGAELVEISLPSTSHALSAYYVISSAEASSNLARFDGVKYGYRAEGCGSLTEMYEKTRSEGFGDEVKRRIFLGTFVLSSGYFDAFYKRAKLMQRIIAGEFESALEVCDVILTPTTPTVAFGLGESIDDPVSMYLNDICTVTANISSLPAMSIPCGKNKDGLPIGMQLFAGRFCENTLFAAAEAYEAALGGDGVLASVL